MEVQSIMEIPVGFLLHKLSNGEVKDSRAIKPQYKSLKKTYKKESNQMFFREALDGKLTVIGEDYDFINSASINDTFKLYIKRGFYNKKGFCVTAQFNKTDCSFDHSKHKAVITLTQDDKYTNILNGYENTYDLIKLAPIISKLTLTKRSVVQIYVKGEETVSSYSGGTYWETGVNEVIDSGDALINKYHFSLGPSFGELYIDNIDFPVGGTYKEPQSLEWENENGMCRVRFVKERSKGDSIQYPSYSGELTYVKGYSLSTYAKVVIGKAANGGMTYLYDMYRIYIDVKIFSIGFDGEYKTLYKSEDIFAKDTDNITLAAGSSQYKMLITDDLPNSGLTPDDASQGVVSSYPHELYLGDYAIEYQIYGRLVCDADVASDGTELYDLPYDDFAIERANYKKCIGLRFTQSGNSVCQIYQTANSTDIPNSYGQNDYGKYFMPPYDPSGQVFYPVARSSWANTSMWIKFVDMGQGAVLDFETWNSQFYREYTLRNAYHIADVISALLKKIAPEITHAANPEYSRFLYGNSGNTNWALNACQIYITPKSNILKGQYDQAAQKAEITFKQIMDMLRDCYRCYWYIDDNNRLIIEHVTYFLNGFSYDTPGVQFDATENVDKFNKNKMTYVQREVEFDKSELYSRYEFGWSDDVTDSMGNLHVDIKNVYIKKDNKSEINISGFCPDVDYMLFMPSDFSMDGFTLLMANSSKKVPIIRTYILDEKSYNARMLVAVQNWFASWNSLINHYMCDMPGNDISYNNIYGTMYVLGIKRCMIHNVDLQLREDLSTKGLVKTDEGNGYIEDMSVDISTGLASIKLSYMPV